MRLFFLCGALVLAGPVAAGADEAAPRHWSLNPPGRPAVPRFADPAHRQWVRNPVDAFVLARLAREGLSPSPEADRRTLIRRVTFDLTGLPPAPEDVEAFVGDSSPDAYEKLVERLLASPRYGERWGRHWLDVVRYAETEGFEYDRARPDAWRYRDYVIEAFNRDTPYDRFVTEQLAGDEADPASHEARVAAGFHRLGPVRRNAGNQELAFSRHEVLTEMTDVVGAAFLGLTVGCARCHDHKFDDISLADYYHLQAFLASAQEHDQVLTGADVYARWKARADKINFEIRQLRESLPDRKGDDRERARAKIRALEKSLPPTLPTISTVANDEARRTPVHVLKRGNTERKGPRVGPRVLSALAPAGDAGLPPDAPKPRTALARWVVGPDNPLTARVMVNRLWQGHFGRGLVATANDFGVNGARPSHPELLDWLANEFVAGSWRVKPLHRLLVLSAAYRQASRGQDVVDPENRLLGRYPRRRLSAEEVRDALLSVAGRLNGKMAGPSVTVPVDADLVALLYAPSQWAVTRDKGEHDRRSVYLLAKRNLRLPFLEVFDQPDGQTSCAQRESSTHALQALELLNGATTNDLAASFARRLAREAGPDPARQVERAYRLAAGRLPGPKEQALAVAFLEKGSPEEFALAVFNLNAFLYVD